MMKTKPFITTFPLLALLGTIIGTAHAATVPVDIANFAFNPDPVTINAGDTVVWTQRDTTVHTVTSGNSPTPNRLFDSGNLSLNQTFSHTFTTPGTFPYFCIPHSTFMTGTVIVTGTAANNPPTVNITSPAPGATFTAPANITISANAGDSDGNVTSVEFFDNGASLGVKTTAPYSVSATLNAGTHTFTAKATDNKGASTTSAGVSVTVNAPANNPPTVTITQPANNATIPAPGNVTFQASASDPDGSVAQVQYFEGRTSLGTSTTSPYSVSVTLAPGQHVVLAVAVDNQGLTGSSGPVTINVSAAVQPPTVDLAGPASGSTFTAPASFTLHATASSSGGSITKIEIFSNGNLIGTGTTSPFDLPVNNLAAGSYAFTAKATDNQGASTTSAAINVTVNASVTQAPKLGSPQRLPDGQFKFSVQGSEGVTYSIEGSANLVVWTALGNVTISGGVGTFTDTAAGTLPFRFYRAVKR